MRRGAGFAVGMIVLGALVGVLTFGLVRLSALPAPAVVHYHANWALFVDGRPLDLRHDRYMEDVVRCKADPTLMEPEDRVHLHNMEPEVVHVHAGGATWGHLLANLGFGVGDDYLVTDTGERLVGGGGRTLKFVLNGEQVPSIRNRLIEDEDRLLISFGAEPLEEVARTQFPRVASSAAEHNTRPDPAGCAGPAEETTADRLRRAFWF